MVRHGGKSIRCWLLVGAVLCAAAGPALPLVASTLGQESTRPVWTDAFRRSVQSTLWLGAGVSTVSLLIGLPLGLLASLYRFPARRSLVLFQALPLLLPSFLPCIGWSNLAAAKWLWWLPTPDGLAGCVFV
ncbi:MAG: hypothetical protein ACC628_23530, partial [Pirellulaceae bacterium]